ncbi:MAG: aspartyl/asparaginyl beta-hydroxylase domain-containing protein [Gammaproteobacteria bacterium]
MPDGFDKREHLVACRRLSMPMDVARLQHEVAHIPAEAWDNQRAPVHRETVSVFLKGSRPMLGSVDNPDQAVLQRCPYIRELIYGLLPGRPGKCLLAALRPKGIVYPHTDAATDYFVQSYRVHIPVFTNPDVAVFCNGRFFHMRMGEAWLLNNLAPHAVINDHPDISRVHLIFDVFPDIQAISMIDGISEEPGTFDTRLYARLGGRSSGMTG